MPPAYLTKEQQQELARRKAFFAQINRFATYKGGWLVSLPGANPIRLECESSSDLPRDLEALGYRLKKVDQRKRLVPSGTTESLTLTSSGAFQAAQGSTKPIATTVGHAGDVVVDAYELIA
jgi:hypothetical protein